ncbi:bacteriohemerythrin [Motiliproteus sediminis]|uniref:bacteriohemerythrin n=1 Tax=Motiliproteus sediminis TaxID=1468178 RepID=UPI001AEF4611
MKKLSIYKLLMIFAMAVFIGLPLIVTPLSISLNNLRDSYSRYVILVESNLALKDARFHIVQIQQFLTDVGATADRAVFAEADKSLERAESNLNQFIALVPEKATEGRRLIKEARALHEVGVVMANAYIDQGREAGNAIMQRPETGLDDVSLRLSLEVESLVNSSNEELRDFHSVVDKTLSNSLSVVSLGLGCIILMVLAAIAIIYFKVLPPILKLRESMQAIAAGKADLTAQLPIQSEDEIGDICRHFNEFVRELRGMVTEVVGTSRRIFVTSEQLGHSTEMTLKAVRELGLDTQSLTSDAQQAVAASHRIDIMANALQRQMDGFEIGSAAIADASVETVVWSKGLATQIDDIDDQHKRLISIYNQLHEALRTGQGPEVMGHILESLVEYTATHFQFEEALFSHSDYPDTEQHKDQHAKLLAQLDTLRKRHAGGNPEVMADILAFLRNWLLNHIMGSDMDYVPHVKDAQASASA